MIISNGYLLHLVLLDGLAQQSKHATAKDGDDDEDDSFVTVNCEQIQPWWDFFCFTCQIFALFHFHDDRLENFCSTTFSTLNILSLSFVKLLHIREGSRKKECFLSGMKERANHVCDQTWVP